jgi:amidase
MGAEERERARARVAQNPGDVFAAAAVEPHARWLQETVRRLSYRAAWQRYFESHDAFLLPATTGAAFRHDHSEPIFERVLDSAGGKRSYVQDLPYWIVAASVAGLPATVAPVGRTAAGLPAGLQIVAPMWEDATSIELAALLSDRLGGFAAPPAFPP